MRAFFLLPFLALPAWAEDFTLNAPVTDVTVYPKAAKLVRMGGLALPAGTHHILLPLTGGLGNAGLPHVTSSEGVTIIGCAIIAQRMTDPETAYLPTQIAAQNAVKLAQDTVNDRKIALEQARSTIPAIDAQLAFLHSTSAAALTTLDAVKLNEVTALLGTQIAALQSQKQDTNNALRPLREALKTAERALFQAENNLARLTPPKGAVDVLAISVQVDAPVDANIRVEGLTYSAGWAPEYDLHLTSGANARLQMERKVAVYQSSGTPWEDITLRLSTVNPTIAIAPVKTKQDKVSMVDRGYRGSFSSEPMMEPVLMEQMDAPPRHAKGMSLGRTLELETIAHLGGLSVQYDYPVPVSVMSGNERLVLNLDTLTLPAETFVRAVPKFDDTAFLMTTVKNDLSEPLLPGRAALYRDGTFIGQGAVPLIVANAEKDLPFGALENIRLSYRRLQNDTGDRGLISTSNTRVQKLEFTVENLMTTQQSVQTLFALPFSEQEDLEITTRARPQPSESNWDKMRNVGQWDFTLAPGQTQTVTVDVDMRWPEGQEVIWQP